MSMVNCAPRKTCNFRPFRRCMCFSVDSNTDVLSGISHLLFLGSPSAVRLAVWSININSVKRHPRRRSWSHILQKLTIRISPFIAHGNASAAVERISLVSRIKASAFCIGPSGIFRGVRVCTGRFGGKKLLLITAATGNARQMSCENFLSSAAITYA